MLLRQGDVFLETVPQVPQGALNRPDVILAEGELTGHLHQIEDPASAVVLEHRGQTYLQVLADEAKLVHEEHGPIMLPRGFYRFWRQREYGAVPSRFGVQHDIKGHDIKGMVRYVID